MSTEAAGGRRAVDTEDGDDLAEQRVSGFWYLEEEAAFGDPIGEEESW
jgi:hypothetical protein